MGDSIDGEFSAAVLTATIGDDAELIASVAGTFLQVREDLRGRLSGAVAARDSAAVTHAAHELKGMSGMIGASRLAQAARAVEMAGRAGDDVAFRDADLLARLEVEWERVARVLQTLLPVR